MIAGSGLIGQSPPIRAETAPVCVGHALCMVAIEIEECDRGVCRERWPMRASWGKSVGKRLSAIACLMLTAVAMSGCFTTALIHRSVCCEASNDDFRAVVEVSVEGPDGLRSVSVDLVASRKTIPNGMYGVADKWTYDSEWVDIPLTGDMSVAVPLDIDPARMAKSEIGEVYDVETLDIAVTTSSVTREFLFPGWHCPANFPVKGCKAKLAIKKVEGPMLGWLHDRQFTPPVYPFAQRDPGSTDMAVVVSLRFDVCEKSQWQQVESIHSRISPAGQPKYIAVSRDELDMLASVCDFGTNFPNSAHGPRKFNYGRDVLEGKYGASYLGEGIWSVTNRDEILRFVDMSDIAAESQAPGASMSNGSIVEILLPDHPVSLTYPIGYPPKYFVIYDPAGGLYILDSAVKHFAWELLSSMPKPRRAAAAER
ncbi:hypothetical protein D3874_14775 [Oleomonas cavernae]|uniref:Uncharacterized protein n=1 Tax=Oleomonas cavernae TaxID=2320859 RepID=A0A418WDT1_9PROT|nr:hypothetical protein [Oleomonas cavernae]RJF88126.1 hypothetical protein D3874_14775 [Oleomonas cavernae]